MTTHDTGTTKIREFQGSSLLTLGGALGALGLVGFLAGWLSIAPKQALFSYLTAYMYGLSIALGGLIFLFINYVMRSKWPVPLRRITETIAGTVTLFFLLSIPIIIARSQIFPWMNVSGIENEEYRKIVEHVLPRKAAYLNDTFFLIRWILYFAIWIGFITVLRRLSLANDKDATVDTSRGYKISAAGVILTAFALSFASFDWVMGLAPEWFSTMFGVHYFAGGFIGFSATLIIVSGNLRTQGYLSEIIKDDHFHAMGRLMFAFIVFWAYVSYAQGFIIYIANKPEEVSWYIVRTHNGWENFGWLLIVGHFGIPFVILLLRWLKFLSRPLSIIAGWMLLMHYVDLYFMVMPNLNAAPTFHWLDVASLVGVMGSMAAFGAYLLRGKLVAPHNDPFFARGRKYRSP